MVGTHSSGHIGKSGWESCILFQGQTDNDSILFLLRHASSHLELVHEDTKGENFT